MVEPVEVQTEINESNFNSSLNITSTIVYNESENITYFNSSNLTNSSLNKSKSIRKVKLVGNYVRFYISTPDGLQSVALTEGMTQMHGEDKVEAVFVGSNDGKGTVLIKVNDELSKPLEEKEGKIVGGTYIFITEILYKN